MVFDSILEPHRTALRLYAVLFCSIGFYSFIFGSIGFYSFLFGSVCLYSVLFGSMQLYVVLFSFIWIFAILCDFPLPCSYIATIAHAKFTIKLCVTCENISLITKKSFV